MAKIRWTPQAADDLEAITEFIAADSEQYARLFAMRAIGIVEHAARFPEAGRVVPEIGAPAIREVLVGRYRIIYRIKPEVIEIIAIQHGARLLDPERLP